MVIISSHEIRKSESWRCLFLSSQNGVHVQPKVTSPLENLLLESLTQSLGY